MTEPTREQLLRAAWRWQNDRNGEDREYDTTEEAYFLNNWRYFPGLRAAVERELQDPYHNPPKVGLDPKAAADQRPTNCRLRLRDEGKPYPRSGCRACNYALKSGIVLGCPHEQVEKASSGEKRDAAG